ncbi:MAG: HAMP domain-containing histidine kinase [Oceanospirillaceae bacterium]|nr:HAMP domain-containing histidine kinase [Oceanospirillaceae bacterium]
MPIALSFIFVLAISWFTPLQSAAMTAQPPEKDFGRGAITEWQEVVATSEANNSAWVEGNFANLGFTASTLLMRSTPATNSASDYYLQLSPIYLDQLDVRFTDKSGGAVLQTYKLGDRDKQTDRPDIIRAPSQIFIKLPHTASLVEIAASSTSNLRLRVNYVSSEELPRLTQRSAFSASLLVTVISISVLLAFAAGLIYKSRSLFLFVAYQLSWLLLLSGIFYPLVSTPFWSLQTNHWIVSIGAISATLFGALTHAQIIQEFSGTYLVPRFLRAAAVIAALLLGVLIGGYEVQALELNILLISTIPALLFFAIPLIKQRNTSEKIWQRIKYGYVVLMGSVVVTGVSGLGIGDLFDITYIHALLTTLLMSGILIMGLRAQNAELRERAQQSLLESQKSKLLEEQLSESKAMFEMLSHEIKTPLTTLSMLLISSKNRERAGRQIDAIRTIIEQTAIALNISDLHSNPEYHNLERAVLDNWQFLASQSEGRTLDLRVDPAVSVYADGLLMDIALRNVLKNAMKYSVPSSAVKVYTVTRRHDVLLVVSNQSKIVYDDDSSFFRKYWRSAESRSIRGSGLGLWLVKRIAEEAGINVSIELSRNTFRILFHIPEKRQR